MSEEHNFNTSDSKALESLKELMEFTTPISIRKSLQTTLFAYLKEQAESGQDAHYKQVIIDYQLLIEFLDNLDE